MDVTLLGTGAALPSPSRVQTGVLLEDADRCLLVDCGSGVVHRLAQCGVDHRDVSTVLLTHHHLDHVADLPTLVKARVLTDHEALTLVGPTGTAALAEHLFAVDDLHSRADLTVEEFPPDTETGEVAGFSLAIARTQHTARSVAYRFGDALVISGDTTPDDAVFALADGVDTLVHECAYPDTATTADHTTPAGLVDGLQGIDIERLVVTHLFPSAEAREDEMLATLTAEVDASVHVAEDRMQLAIPSGLVR